MINGAEIAYEVTGDGEPVLLIHGAFVADAMRPLAEQLDGYRVIRYHRRGYGESGGGVGPDVATHAADARALLEHLDATPAHIIGHSYGGSTALALAASAPDAVRSLVLLEAATPGQIPSAEVIGGALGQVVAPAMEGKLDEAVDRFLHMVLGRDWRKQTEEILSAAAVEQALADGDDAIVGDLGSLAAFAITGEDAARITCPALIVLGGSTDETVRTGLREMGIETPDVDVFGEMTAVQLTWLPQADVVTLAGINHSLQMQDPSKVADAIEPFLAEQRQAAPA
jgi:pimeloyl-ACP methyl ester carboxylesterase